MTGQDAPHGRRSSRASSTRRCARPSSTTSRSDFDGVNQLGRPAQHRLQPDPDRSADELKGAIEAATPPADRRPRKSPRARCCRRCRPRSRRRPSDAPSADGGARLAGAAGRRRSAPRRDAPAASTRSASARAGRAAAAHEHEDDENEIEATKAPLMEHLIELRSRLIKSLLAFVVMFFVCFFFAKHDLQRPVWPFVWIAGRGERAPDLHRAARVLLHPDQGRDVRARPSSPSRSSPRRSTCSSRRALPQRAQGVPALSGRDADLLPARRSGRLLHRHADAGALLASACSRSAGRRTPTIELLPKVDEYLSLIMTLIFAFGIASSSP